MAEAFNFELVSPERLVLSEGVNSVLVPGMDGYFTVLKDHAPVVASISPGVLNVELEDGTKRDIYVRGGFADVAESGLKVLAEQAVPVEDLDAAQIAQLIKDAEEDVADAKDDDTKNEAEIRLGRLKNLQTAIS
ncbi:MAG: F0F1 ATP synthase subunit epsilon [Cohaesibacter sp.]|jgi:F-type H+-transporting ATPase subunit epsilon|nr:F0F1 ATP synthase subunit epsilon [Cohaesibacter sp.]